MKKLIIPMILIGIFATSIHAQNRKPPKPKPEEEETGKAGVIKETKFAKRSQIKRTKLHSKPPTRLGSMNFGVFSNEYLGFGASYEMNRHTDLGISFSFYYYPIPDDQLYFDPYYYQFVQRNKGSMMILYIGGKYHLPFMKNEPNINPYAIFGGGPVLGIESDQSKQWPGSMLHAFAIGGYSAYGGAGMEYRINSWAVSFDLRYQFLRFPNQIFGEKYFDGLIYNIGIGKLF